MKKSVPSHKYKEQNAFYILQRQLDEGGEGKTHLAKRKIERIDPVTRRSLRTIREYFCIK